MWALTWSATLVNPQLLLAPILAKTTKHELHSNTWFAIERLSHVSWFKPFWVEPLAVNSNS